MFLEDFAEESCSDAFYTERRHSNCHAELQTSGLVFTGEDHLCSWIFVLYEEDFTIS